MSEKFKPAELFRVLVGHDVRFVVIGGVAGQLHGAPMVTLDLDICYERTKENADRLVDALRELGASYRGAPPDLPFQLDATTIRNGDSFTFDTKFGSFDCLGTPSGSGGYAQLKVNAVSMPIGELEVDVVALEDLIRMKRAAGRNKDLLAVEELSALRDEIDSIEDTWGARRALKTELPRQDRSVDSKPEARASRDTLEQLERAKRMRRAGQVAEAENLLLALIDRAEAGSPGVEHWFYEHLAVLYHERRDHAREVATVERYLAQAPASPAMSTMMSRRLESARAEVASGLKS